MSKRGGYFDLSRKEDELRELETEMSESSFWSAPTQAKVKSQKHDDLKKELNTWWRIEKETEDLQEFAEMAQAEEDDFLRKEIEKKLKSLQKRFQKLEFFVLLSEKYDNRQAIVSIHAGAGGVDAQDWAAMLMRMYLRYSEKKGWVIKVIDKSVGQEAGLKSITFEVLGQYAYGFLKGEAGVHRLVRISPFDAEKMRHTSFALVEVIPELEEVEEVKLEPKDLRIDTFLSGGHGGQGVQTTYSAVRIVHLPTGITVSCQNERSQTQNKETALKILKSKLHKLYQEEKDLEKIKLRGTHQEAAWGNQIRSYVLQPYKMVKDHRTKFEVKDVDRVLDGELDELIEQYLRNMKHEV